MQDTGRTMACFSTLSHSLPQQAGQQHETNLDLVLFGDDTVSLI